MAWVTPVTDWTSPDGVQDSDMNRIEGNTLENHTLIGDLTGLPQAIAASNLAASLTAFFNSVTSSRQSLFTAISNKGVTPASNSFPDLIAAIGNVILGSGNAATGDVLSGRTFTNAGGSQLTGTMPNRANSTVEDDNSNGGTVTQEGVNSTGAWARYQFSVDAADAGFFNGTTRIRTTIYGANRSQVKHGDRIGGGDSTRTGTYTSDGTIAAGDVLAAKIAYSVGQRIVGTLTNNKGRDVPTNERPSTSTNIVSVGRASSGDGSYGILKMNMVMTAAVNGTTKITQNVFGAHRDVVKFGHRIGAANSAELGNYTGDGNIASSQVLQNQIAYSRGNRIVGTMPNRSTSAQTPHSISGTDLPQALSVRPSTGYYNSGAANSYIAVADNDYIAANIKRGVSIFGLTGTAATLDVGEETSRANMNAVPNQEIGLRVYVRAPDDGNTLVEDASYYYQIHSGAVLKVAKSNGSVVATLNFQVGFGALENGAIVKDGFLYCQAVVAGGTRRLYKINLSTFSFTSTVDFASSYDTIAMLDAGSTLLVCTRENWWSYNIANNTISLSGTTAHTCYKAYLLNRVLVFLATGSTQIFRTDNGASLSFISGSTRYIPYTTSLTASYVGNIEFMRYIQNSDTVRLARLTSSNGSFSGTPSPLSPPGPQYILASDFGLIDTVRTTTNNLLYLGNGMVGILHGDELIVVDCIGRCIAGASGIKLSSTGDNMQHASVFRSEIDGAIVILAEDTSRDSRYIFRRGILRRTI